MYKVITQKDFNRIVKKAEKEKNAISITFNMKQFRTYQASIINGIINATNRKQSSKCLAIVTIECENMGTSKYPHWEQKVVVTSLLGRKENETQYYLYGKLKKNILCFIK